MYNELMRRGDRELIRKINQLERRLDGLVMPELSPALASPLLDLPMLRGAWIGMADPDGDWVDASGQEETLSDASAPVLNYTGVVPYMDLDGAGDYFFNAAAGFDIRGTEAQVAAAIRGLTVMCWFYPEETGTVEMLIAKWGGGGDRAYRLYLDASDQVNMEFSDDGTNSDTATSSAVSMTAWFFSAGRVRIADGSVDVFVGTSAGLKETNQATARASIHDSPTDFQIGARAGSTEEFQGWIACPAVCACACSNAQISSVFNRQRAAFKV